MYFFLEKKDILLPVDRSVRNFLWKEIILCTLVCGERCLPVERKNVLLPVKRKIFLLACGEK